MDPRLLTLIREYHSAVAQAVELLSTSGIPRPLSDYDWATSTYPQLDQPIDTHRFYKHGFGCAVLGPTWRVNFDFGRQGEITGFTCGWLCEFSRHRRDRYGFAGDHQIEAVFNQAIEEGKLRFSGYILYYLSEDFPSG